MKKNYLYFLLLSGLLHPLQGEINSPPNCLAPKNYFSPKTIEKKHPLKTSISLLFKYLDTQEFQLIQDLLSRPTKKSDIYLDQNTIEHSVKVAILSFWIGLKLNFSENELRSLFLSSIFHDIGKSHPKTREDLDVTRDRAPSRKEKWAHVHRGQEMLDYYLLKHSVNSLPLSDLQAMLEAIEGHHYFFEGYSAQFEHDDTYRPYLLQTFIIAIADHIEAATNASRRRRRQKHGVLSMLSFLEHKLRERPYVVPDKSIFNVLQVFFKEAFYQGFNINDQLNLEYSRFMLFLRSPLDEVNSPQTSKQKLNQST